MKRLTLFLFGLIASGVPVAVAASADRWSAADIELLRSLSLAELGPLPADPTNRVADDPRAAELGRQFFFDPRFSANGLVSCATCHLPERDFQDGRALSAGVGTTDRRAMPIAGTARLPFLFWDGRKDSPWAQALGPLESPVEHGGTRAQYAHVVAEHYRADYERIFGPLPDLSAIPRVAGPVADPAAARAWRGLPPDARDRVTEVFVNLGKAIAAYERRIEPGPTRFDTYVDAIVRTGRAPAGVLTGDEVAGLRLFTGKANCLQCHNGPLLTNGDFHNTGIPANPALPPDRGRIAGARQVLADEFNRRSQWSDAPAQATELDFLATGAPEQERAFKVPSLRNVAERAPYMHAGQLADLGEVLRHYNRAPAAPGGRTELKPLKLSDRELGQLEAFLRTLSGPTLAPDRGHSVPTGIPEDKS
jgi:cytochrome c peroxidase